MADLPILIPSTEEDADGYSLVPLNVLQLERMWPPLEGDRALVGSVFDSSQSEGSEVRGHDLATEERDVRTGQWRPRAEHYRYTSRTPSKRKDVERGRSLNWPVRMVGPKDYKQVRQHEPNAAALSAAINTLRAALKQKKNVGEALNAVVKASGRNSEALQGWIEEAFSSSYALSYASQQLLASRYLSRLVFPGRLLFWTTAARDSEIRLGLFFPARESAVNAGIVLNDELRICLKCGNPFAPDREDQLGCTTEHSASIRQQRHHEKKKRRTGAKKNVHL